MINDADDNMDTANALMDKEQFSKEELIPIDQDDEENDRVCNCNDLYIFYMCILQKQLIGLLEEPDLSAPNDDIMVDLPQLEPSPCSDHEAVLSAGVFNLLL